MQTLRLHGARDLRLHDEPMPMPRPDESLIRVTAVGICGSDLHWFREGGIGDTQLARPLILGHEFTGIATDGTRVAVDPLIACGECEPCREGDPHLCLVQRFAGHGEDDGALREYIAWPTRCLFPLPDTLSDEEGVMLEPLGIAIHSLRRGEFAAGMSVAVLGCGPIGLLLVQLARVSGASHIFATEKLPHRLDAARVFGAQVFSANGTEAEQILAATSGRGVDIAFEAAGDNAAVETAVAAAKRGGCVVLVGIPDEDRTAVVASRARRKELTIKWVRRMKHTYPRAIDLVASGQVDVRSLITHRFPLAQASEAFSVAARREGIKVIIK